MQRPPLLLLYVIFLFNICVVSCNNAPSSQLDVTTVRAFADPATETTLQGLSENNLAKYIQYGNSEFKALTQEKFNEAVNQINNQLGTYQSKEFLRTEEYQGYILVHYKVKYSKGEVGVRMVFDKDHLVAGQWFE